MTALTRDPHDPFLALFGVQPSPDPLGVDDYRLVAGGGLRSELSRTDTAFTAFNPVIQDLGAKAARPGTWAMAQLTPSFPAGFWQIAVISVGGTLDHTRMPVAGSRVGTFLRRFGVPSATFKPEPARPAPQSPWAQEEKPTAPALRTVYFIAPVDGGRIKIGIASNVAARLANLQTGSPVPLRVIGIIRGVALAVEAELHVRFASCRCHGEWFEPTPELLAYIAEHAEVPR